MPDLNYSNEGVIAQSYYFWSKYLNEKFAFISFRESHINVNGNNIVCNVKTTIRSITLLVRPSTSVFNFSTRFSTSKALIVDSTFFVIKAYQDIFSSSSSVFFSSLILVMVLSEYSSCNVEVSYIGFRKALYSPSLATAINGIKNRRTRKKTATLNMLFLNTRDDGCSRQINNAISNSDTATAAKK